MLKNAWWHRFKAVPNRRPRTSPGTGKNGATPDDVRSVGDSDVLQTRDSRATMESRGNPREATHAQSESADGNPCDGLDGDSEEKVLMSPGQQTLERQIDGTMTGDPI